MVLPLGGDSQDLIHDLNMMSDASDLGFTLDSAKSVMI